MTLSTRHLQTVVNIKVNMGLCVSNFDTVDDYFSAFLQRISFETLYEITNDESVPLDEKGREKIKLELQRRYDKGMGNIQ